MNILFVMKTLANLRIVLLHISWNRSSSIIDLVFFYYCHLSFIFNAHVLMPQNSILNFFFLNMFRNLIVDYSKTLISATE